MLLLGSNGSFSGWGQWADGFCVCTGSLDGDQFPFRIAQCRQLAAKNAAGIDIDSAIEPLRFRYGGMAINHHRLATIVSRPIMANG